MRVLLISSHLLVIRVTLAFHQWFFDLRDCSMYLKKLNVSYFIFITYWNSLWENAKNDNASTMGNAIDYINELKRAVTEPWVVVQQKRWSCPGEEWLEKVNRWYGLFLQWLITQELMASHEIQEHLGWCSDSSSIMKLVFNRRRIKLSSSLYQRSWLNFSLISTMLQEVIGLGSTSRSLSILVALFSSIFFLALIFLRANEYVNFV